MESPRITSTKLHLCCGDVYLKGYINCDIVGEHYLEGDPIFGINPNETTLDNYFKFPFEADITKRVRRPFIVDELMNILEPWPFKDNSMDELVMISCFEHFEHLTEIPHIIQEAYRILKPGGQWKLDFPDVKRQVEEFYESAPEFCIELVYGNHKNRYSVHQWGYTEKTLARYLQPDRWKLTFGPIVQHDYPMIGCTAEKI